MWNKGGILFRRLQPPEGQVPSGRDKVWRRLGEYSFSVYIINITLLQCSRFTALLLIILCLGYHGDYAEVQAAI